MESDIRVFLVDDHQVVRTGICSMLVGESDIRVVGQSDGGEGAVDQIASCAPNVILMDIKMPKIDGIQLASMVKQNLPEANIIMLTLYDEYINQAVAAGANGYLLKDVSRDELIAAIRRAYLGETVLSRELSVKNGGGSKSPGLEPNPEADSVNLPAALEEVQLVVPAPYSAREVIRLIGAVEKTLPTRILQIAGSWAEGTALSVLLREPLRLADVLDKLKAVDGVDAVDASPAGFGFSSDFIRKLTASTPQKMRVTKNIFLTIKREGSRPEFTAARYS